MKKIFILGFLVLSSQALFAQKMTSNKKAIIASVEKHEQA
jgi:hypothetical protein